MAAHQLECWEVKPTYINLSFRLWTHLVTAEHPTRGRMSGRFGWRGCYVAIPPPPSPAEACSNTIVWDFDVTVFIVVYSWSSTLTFRRPSPGYSETVRGWERESHLFLLIFPSLWWMAFLLCHLGLWKMFYEAEEIASFHFIQILHSNIQQSTVWILCSLSLNLYSILKPKNK